MSSGRRARLRGTAGEVLRFGVVGVAATAVHYGTAFLSLGLLAPLAANTVGFLTAVLVSYAGHSRWTFRRTDRRSTVARFQKFLVTATGGLALSQAVLIVAEASGRVPQALSMLAAVLVVPPTTFLLAKLWVFRPTS